MTQIPKRLSEHPKVVTKNKTWEVEIIYSQAEGEKNHLSTLPFGEETRRRSCHYKLQAASQEQPFLRHTDGFTYC